MKATLPNGTVLEGLPEEISQALRGMEDKRNGNAGEYQSAIHPQGGSEASIGTHVWTPDRARKFWNWLYGDQKKLIQFLLEKDGAATLPEIIKHLGRGSGNEIAGIRSCLTRNARRETENSEAAVVEWVHTREGKWVYKLLPEVHELLKEIVATR